MQMDFGGGTGEGGRKMCSNKFSLTRAGPHPDKDVQRIALCSPSNPANL